MNKTDNIKYWDKIIEPKTKRISVQLGRIWDYRDLTGLLVKRDFIVYYKQTIFGPLWYLIQPICSTIMYMLIFGSLAKIGTDSIPQPLFYFSGTMLWTYFSENLKSVSNVFFNNKNLFGKVYFPRLVAPIASTISLLIKLAIQFFLFGLIYIYYIAKGYSLGWGFQVLLFPIVILWLSILSCGIGMLVSAITTKYRDVALILDFLVSLLMYATPVVYPMSEVPERMKILFYANPASVPVEFFRYCFFGVADLPLSAIAYSALITIILFWGGIVMFNRNEKTFVDFI